jgi:hypothetical protein
MAEMKFEVELSGAMSAKSSSCDAQSAGIIHAMVVMARQMVQNAMFAPWHISMIS